MNETCNWASTTLTLDRALGFFNALPFQPKILRLRLFRETPSSARERAFFSPTKDGEAGDVCFIVDAAGCRQAENKPLEARSSFPTEPSIVFSFGDYT